MAPSRPVFFVALWFVATVAAVAAVWDMNNTELFVAPIQCAFEDKKEYYGKSFRSLVLDDPGQCCSACQADPECQVWTYRLEFAERKKKYCWLMKDSTFVDSVRDNNYMISGIRQPKKLLRPNAPLEDGVEYKDKDLFTFDVDALVECASFCATKLLCKSFTYDKLEKICHVKRGQCCKNTASYAVSQVV